MATYPNGEIPDKALTRTSTGHLLRADAAAAFEALADAFELEFGKPLLVTDAYRPKAGTYGQIAIFEDRYPHLTKHGVNDRRGPWKGKYWWRRTGTAAAAVPGTSNHGWGLALDLGSNVNRLGTKEQLWLVANGPRFGWVWPTWARKIPTLEPWHYEFVGTVTFPIGGGTGGQITTPTIPGRPAPITPEDDMDAAQNAALADIYSKVPRILQILEAFDPQRPRLVEAADRVMGVLPDLRTLDGRVATVLTTAEGQILRNDIATSTARAVAETSSAFHQLVARVDGIETGEIDIDHLATALRTTLGDAVVEALAERLKGA